MLRHRFAPLFFAFTLAALLASCSRGGLTPLPGTAAVNPRATGAVSGTPALTPDADFAALLAKLQAGGATVETGGNASASIFTAPGRIVRVNGGEVQIFEYKDAAALNSAAGAVSADGGKVGGAVVDWAGAPHFFKQGRLLAVYVGTDGNVSAPLMAAMGNQFAGAPLPPTPTPKPGATPTPAASATSTPAAAACTDRAQMTADVTIPDRTVVTAGKQFVKTWRLKNAGTCAWSTDYGVVYARGEKMGAPDVIPLPSAVAAGGSVDVSVTLTAPTTPGTYRGYYQLRNAAGKLFGIGSNANGVFWVEIIVR